jgi:hypothetical protein
MNLERQSREGKTERSEVINCENLNFRLNPCIDIRCLEQFARKGNLIGAVGKLSSTNKMDIRTWVEASKV